MRCLIKHSGKACRFSANVYLSIITVYQNNNDSVTRCNDNNKMDLLSQQIQMLYI